MGKWILRTGVEFVALSLLGLGVAFTNFYLWRADLIERLKEDPDRRVATTALGDIEYAVVGEGVPVLALSGSPGGYDQSLLEVRAVPEVTVADVMTIAVSRPGSLDTPLGSGMTYEEEADLFAALLDELGVDRVIVLATSGGGRAALRFALQHPNRTMGLVLRSATTKSDSEDEAPTELGEIGLLAADMVIWAGFTLIPALWIDDYDSNDDVHEAIALAVAESLVPLRARWDGNLNDIRQSLDPAIDSWPLEEISAPTLILHGNADSLVSYEDAQDAAARIPNAQLVTFEDGGHFVYLTKLPEVTTHVTQFIQSLTSDAENSQQI